MVKSKAGLGSTRFASLQSEPMVSLVLPVHEQAKSIGRSLKRLAAYCSQNKLPAEVVVVDDGSTDETGEVAVRWTEHFQSLVVLRHGEARGLGAAARTGALVARGKWVIVTDSDLSVAIEELPVLLDALDSGADVAVASRAIEGSEIARGHPWPQRASEGVLKLFVRLFVRPGVRDTFSGTTAWLRGAARAAAERAHSSGLGYAAEWIGIAQRLGLHVVECPVRWESHAQGLEGTDIFPVLRELVHAGKRLKGAEYLAPLPARQALHDTSFIRYDAAAAGWQRAAAAGWGPSSDA